MSENKLENFEVFEPEYENEASIPEHHRALCEELGWSPKEYQRRISVLEQDGVTLEQLAEWKRKYGEVYRTTFIGRPFYYRAMTRPEYREHIVNSTMDYNEREEFISSMCTLYPQEYDFASGPAGIASRLMELILDHSGFVTDGPTMSF